MKLGEEVKIKGPFPIMKFCFFLFWIPAIVAAFVLNDYVLGGVIFAVGLGCWIGFRKGAIKAISMIAFVIAAVYLGPKFLYLVEPKFREWFEFTGLFNRVASLVAITFGLGIVLTGVVAWITWMFMPKDSTGERVNQFFGLLIGGGEVFVAAILFLGGIQIVEPMVRDADQQREEEQVGGVVNWALVGVPVIAEKTKSSLIGPLIEKHNPFTKYPQYNPLPKARKTAQLLSNPSLIKDMLTEESTMKRLQTSQAFSDAANKLSLDPAMQEILAYTKTPGLGDIIVLLKSDSVLEILDQPGFLEEAATIFNESRAVSELMNDEAIDE